jgi:transcriptional regulator with XRE-family HTH domain
MTTDSERPMAEWTDPLRARRDELGWTQMRAALEIRSAAGRAGQPDLAVDGNMVSRWERGIRPSRFYARWIAEAYGRPAAGLGLIAPPAPRTLGRTRGSNRTLMVRSHMFVPVYCTPEALDTVAARPPTAAGYQAAVGGQCASSLSTHAFPFGIVVLHIREEVEFPGVTGLAAWRTATYHRVRAAIDAELTEVSGAGGTEYVFSMYEILQHPWAPGRPLRSGMRLISMPSVLLPRSERSDVWQAEQAEISRGRELEERLIAQGFEHSEVREFGISGVSVGCASWSAVAYHALGADQHVGSDRLVNIEVQTQALWAWCSRVIADQRPLVDYSWFGVEGLRSHAARLLAPSQPMEGTDECLAREAIVETSRLRSMLDQAERVLS